MMGANQSMPVFLAGEVGVGRHLPAGEIDRLEPGLHHLHRLIAGIGAERGHEGSRVQELPEPARAALGEGVFDLQGAREPRHLLGTVVAADAVEAAGVDAAGGGGALLVERRHDGLLAGIAGGSVAPDYPPRNGDAPQQYPRQRPEKGRSVKSLLIGP